MLSATNFPSRLSLHLENVSVGRKLILWSNYEYKEIKGSERSFSREDGTTQNDVFSCFLNNPMKAVDYNGLQTFAEILSIVFKEILFKCFQLPQGNDIS
ncbi:hypothetical protein ACH3XW_46715 [Acanthocheilonema viteae]